MLQFADTVVVGGGVIGLSIAYELVQRGQKVILFERGSFPGCGATYVSGGLLAPVSETEGLSDTLRAFGWDSLERYPAFVASIESIEAGAGGPGKVGYRTEGTLWVGFNQDDAAHLENLACLWKAQGLDATVLGPSEMRSKEPHLAPRIYGGVEVPSDHQVDPRALAYLLAEALKHAGGHVYCQCTVEEVVVSRGAVQGVRVCDPTGQRAVCQSDAVVVAAGAWSSTSLLSECQTLGVRPVKGQMVRLRSPPHALLRHVVHTPHVYIIPRADGSLLIGSTVEDQGFCTAPTAGAVLELLAHAWRALPGLYDAELLECMAGLRPAVLDHKPVIGPCCTPGLYVATAHHRNGILLAPATAYYMAELITTSELPLALKPFLPQRLPQRLMTLKSHRTASKSI